MSSRVESAMSALVCDGRGVDHGAALSTAVGAVAADGLACAPAAQCVVGAEAVAVRAFDRVRFCPAAADLPESSGVDVLGAVG